MINPILNKYTLNPMDNAAFTYIWTLHISIPGQENPPLNELLRLGKLTPEVLLIERAPRHRGRKSGPPGQQIRPDFPHNPKHQKQPKFPQRDRRKRTREDNAQRAKTNHPTQHTRADNTQAPDSAHHPILSAGSKPTCLYGRVLRFYGPADHNEGHVFQSRKSRMDAIATTG